MLKELFSFSLCNTNTPNSYSSLLSQINAILYFEIYFFVSNVFINGPQTNDKELPSLMLNVTRRFLLPGTYDFNLYVFPS